jgi:outer membrane lipoprotein SlyB
MFKARLIFKRALPALCFAAGMITNVHAETIAAGTVVTVRTDTDIDTRDTGNGRVYSGVVNKDVYDGDDRIAIPKGSDVELMVRDAGKHSLALDLDAIVIKGRRYSVTTYDVTKHGEDKDGVGANGRTAKYVGGTALFGTILGAVAGGGKGAGIGALAGGAAGAIGQTVTRGSKVHVPAETVLTFQLEQPLSLAPDNGYMQNGHHYHPER